MLERPDVFSTLADLDDAALDKLMAQSNRPPGPREKSLLHVNTAWTCVFWSPDSVMVRTKKSKPYTPIVQPSRSVRRRSSRVEGQYRPQRRAGAYPGGRRPPHHRRQPPQAVRGRAWLRMPGGSPIGACRGREADAGEGVEPGTAATQPATKAGRDRGPAIGDARTLEPLGGAKPSAFITRPWPPSGWRWKALVRFSTASEPVDGSDESSPPEGSTGPRLPNLDPRKNRPVGSRPRRCSTATAAADSANCRRPAWMSSSATRSTRKSSGATAGSASRSGTA